MIEEIQKRPFVRPLFLWITGILCYAFLPASSLLYVLGVLSALVFLFLGFSWGQGHAELQYDSRWIWGAIVSVLIVCLAVEVCWYSDRRIALVNEPASSLDLLATKAQYSLVNTFDRLRLSDEEKSILATLTLGYKKAMSRETKRRFSLAGVSHILAVSGFHVAVICGFLSFFCSFMPRWGIGRWVRYIILVGSLWGFVFITGLAPSAVRAALMLSLYLTGRALRRVTDGYNTLAAAAFCMLAYNPYYLFDVGFQLSFSAVAAIVLVQPKLYALWKVDNRFLRYLWGLMTVSMAAQLGTAPLVIFYFSRFSTHFLLTNLWVIPMVSFVLYSAVFLLMLTPLPFVQHLFARVVEALVHVQNEVLRWIEHLPGAVVDDIWLDIWGVLLVYLFLGMAYYGFLRLTVRRVCFALLALLAVVSWHSLSIMSNVPRQGIAFYSVRGCPVVHCMADNRHSWLACTDSLPDMPRLCRALSPHWNRLRLETPRLVAGDYTTSGLSMRNQIVSYAGKRICLLSDNRWRNKNSSRPLSVDYLYVSKGYQGGIEELTSLFSMGMVVLDASLSDYYQNKIANDCVRLGIPYLLLSQKGSYRILL